MKKTKTKFGLDEARDEAVELLRAMIEKQATYVGRAMFVYPEADERINDLGRQFVTAQARYTNMLRDWESNKS